MNENNQQSFYKNPVFLISTIVVTLFAVWGALFPDGLAKYGALISGFIGDKFGWFYLASVGFFVAFCIFLAFSKYGNIKLGKDGEKPEFSYFAWINMLFAAGFGAGIVFWGVAEPLTHFANPPIEGVEPQTAEAARVAMHYAFFNWGIHQWSVFTLVGLALAYFQFRHKSKLLVSETLKGVSRKKSNSTLKMTVNILAVIATVTGVATSLGMGVLQVDAGLTYVFSIPNSSWLPLVVVGILFVLYMMSAVSGLNKGIRILSNINMVLVIGFMVVFLFQGPTVFILESFVTAIGDYVQNFAAMTFQLTPYTGGTWVKDWTVFYWAWVIGWSPFVGSFVARISRGRTIREFVIGVLIVPPVVAFMWMAIFGGTGIYMDLFQNTGISAAVSEDVATAIFVFLENFPLYGLLSALMLVLSIIFFVTSADSTVYVLGIMTSNGNENPSNLLKAIWGVLIAAISAVLIMSNGLAGVQSIAIISALPFTVILILMSISLIRYLRKDQKALQDMKEEEEFEMAMERKAQ